MRKIIRTRYLLGFSIAALILALIGVAIIMATQQFRRDSRLVLHTYDVIAQTEALRAALLSGISSQRSYLLTDIDAYRQEFDKTRPEVFRDLSGLTTLVKDDPIQAERTNTLGGLIGQRLNLADKNIRLYKQQGLPAAQTYSRNNGGLSLMQQTRDLMDLMVKAERSLLAQRSADTDQSARILLGLGALGIPLSLTILIWIYILLSREVRERAQAEKDTAVLNESLGATVKRLKLASNDLHELTRYAGLLQGCRNVPEALDATRRALSSLMPDCAGVLYLLRASQDQVEAESSWGPSVIGNKPLLPPDECWAMRRNKPHIVADLRHDMVCSHVEPPADGSTAATVCLPLAAQNKSLGFLSLARAGSGPIERMDIAIAAAEQLSLALGNLQLQDSLRQQSIRDALTGLYNRRYLEESLTRELARCERRNRPLALIMLDLDHFKTFNDKHGHEGGDALLAAFGRLLQAHCRHEDIACRYGGEEFTLILPEADLEVASQRAEEIRVAVRAMGVNHLHRMIGGVTVSIGLAMFPEHADGGGRLKQLADAALYRAKREGRNRVEVAAVD